MRNIEEDLKKETPGKIISGAIKLNFWVVLFYLIAQAVFEYCGTDTTKRLVDTIVVLGFSWLLWVATGVQLWILSKYGDNLPTLLNSKDARDAY